ncbi:MAG: tetratricopeptide repeat protein [Desulfobacterales bacterium]|jgi:tetratricopeptide (TPR) repeat protein
MKHNNSINDVFKKGMDEFIDNNFNESIQEFTKAIEIDPEFRLAYVSRGAALMKMDRNEEAIADFDHAVALDPDYPKPYHLRGLARVELGDHEGALKDFGSAIDLDPDYGPAYYSRAALHLELGREDLASDDIQMVQVLTEVNTQTFANESNIWRSQHLRLEEMGVADPMER